MPRKLLYVFVVISIVASALIAANNFEKKKPVYITPFSSEVTIRPNQVGIARWGWGSCSKGLGQDFVDHFVIRLELYKDGKLLQTVWTDQGYWVQNSLAPDATCLHINEPQVDYWQFGELKLKKPGVYTLKFFAETTAPLTDGYDNDQDGFIDLFPTTVFAPREVTIKVRGDD